MYSKDNTNPEIIEKYQPRFIEVRLENLKLNPGYQRVEERDERHINNIVREFDYLRLDPLVVGQDPEKTGIWIIDGQHRYCALLKLGIEAVICRFIKNISFHEQALLFKELNRDRKKVSNISTFRADVFTNDEKAVKISKVIEKYGFRISGKKSGGGGGDKRIGAVRRLENTYNLLTLEQFDRVFKLISFVWGGKLRSLDGRFISGLGYLIKTVGEVMPDDLFIDKFKNNTKITPQDMVTKGQQMGSTNTHPKFFARAESHLQSVCASGLVPDR